MRHWFSRALLAIVIGQGFLAATALAGQDPARYYTAQAPVVQSQASLPYEAQVAAPADTLGTAGRQSFSKRICEKWKSHFGCYTTHNDYGCSTCRSTKIFIFGSCREFFGETCEKSPPPGPVPPGYQRHSSKGGCNSPECLLNH